MRKKEAEAERRAAIRLGKQKERTGEEGGTDEREGKGAVEHGVDGDRGRRMERGRRTGRGRAWLAKRVAVGTGS